MTGRETFAYPTIVKKRILLASYFRSCLQKFTPPKTDREGNLFAIQSVRSSGNVVVHLVIVG